MAGKHSTALTFHPIASIFPLLEGDPLAALTADIKAHGLREPIVLHQDGSILDGRNRYRACLAAGVEPRYETYRGLVGAPVGSALAYVISLNLIRRHLDESQRAMVADSIATLVEGARPTASKDAVSQTEAAGLLNVSRPSVQRAHAVRTSGVPELIRAVEQAVVPVTLAAKVANLPKVAQRDVLAAVKAGRTPAQAYRGAAHAAVESAREWPAGKFGVIYADPPWQDDNSGFTQSAAEHYPTMATDTICGIPVPGLATDSAVCFLWITSPLLPDGLRVLKTWGFDYRASMVWIKDRAPGIGWWVQTKHEFLLIGVRGDSVPDVRPVSVLTGAVSKHSRKPDEAYVAIEAMFPRAPKIELFARAARPGWTSWGNECASATAK